MVVDDKLRITKPFQGGHCLFIVNIHRGQASDSFSPIREIRYLNLSMPERAGLASMEVKNESQNVVFLVRSPLNFFISEV